MKWKGRRLLAMALTGILLAGCGAAGQVDDYATNEGSTQEASTKTTGTESGGISKDKIKVGVLHLSDPAEGSGYTYTHDLGIQAMQQNLGLSDEQIDRKINVDDSDKEATEKAIQECVDDGCNIIFTTSWGYMDATEEMAEKYPDIWFFDIKAGQLYIYEYQKSQYCGLESSLEPFSQKFLQQKVTEERTELQRMLTPVNTILVFVNVVVFMILSFLGSTTDAEFMAAHGAMDWMDVVEKHQYYRLFTSMFLHFGADHLLQNMLILLVIGCRLERITGKLSYLLIYIGAGLIGAGTSIIFTL